MSDPVFGCPDCGGGGDFPTLPDADAARDEEQKQYLYKFNGRWLCKMCIEDEKSRIYSMNESDKLTKGEKARASMGFS